MTIDLDKYTVLDTPQYFIINIREVGVDELFAYRYPHYRNSYLYLLGEIRIPFYTNYPHLENET